VTSVIFGHVHRSCYLLTYRETLPPKQSFCVTWSY